MHPIGRDATQTRLVRYLGQLVHQCSCARQSLVLHLYVGPFRTKYLLVAASGLHGGLAPARKQEPHQRTVTTASEQDQAVYFSSQGAPRDNWGLWVCEIGVGEQTAEPGVAGRILSQRDEVAGAGRDAKDRLGNGQLYPDDGPDRVRSAGSLEADDSSEGHVVGEGEGAHPERRCPRHQGLGRGGATEETERTGQMQLDIGVTGILGNWGILDIGRLLVRGAF
jgi:hypothetical protein